MITAGSIIVAFGVLFMAQSQSLVGPESSFMYRNPEWMINGSMIAALGGAILAGGIILGIKRRQLTS